MPLRLDTCAKTFAGDFAALLSAKREMGEDVDAVVAAILADVKKRGDVAVIECTKRFDRLALTPATMRVPAKDIAAAAASCAPETLDALRFAAQRIEAYHRRQIPEDFAFTDAVGVRLCALDVGLMATLLNEAGTVTFTAAAVAAMPTSVGPAAPPPMSMAAVAPATGVQFTPSEDIAAL